MTKEETYDVQIAPLMTQIIEICQAHDIPMLATFQIDDDRPASEAGFCTTAIVPDDASPNMKAAKQVIVDGFVAFAVTMRTP